MVLDSQETYNIGLKCQIVASTINTLASLLTLYVIVLLPKNYRNGYLSMIFLMTLSQTFYDASLLSYNAPVDYPGYNDALATGFYMGVLFGVNSSFWTFIISGVTAYVIWTRRYVAVQDNIPLFVIVNFILSFVIATSFIVPYVRGDTETLTITFAIYNYARLLIIVGDVMAVYLIFVVLKSLKRKNMMNNYEIDSSYYPMYLLAKRLMLYPVVQTVSRIPVTIYQLHYNETISQYASSPHPDTFKTALLFIGFWCTPISGIGNCIVFFNMQKGAWKTLKEKVLCYKEVTELPAQEDNNNSESIVCGGKSGSLGVFGKSGSLGVVSAISNNNSAKSWITLSSLSRYVKDVKDDDDDDDLWRKYEELDDEELTKAVGTAFRESSIRNSESRNIKNSKNSAEEL